MEMNDEIKTSDDDDVVDVSWWIKWDIMYMLYVGCKSKSEKMNKKLFFPSFAVSEDNNSFALPYMLVRSAAAA